MIDATLEKIPVELIKRYHILTLNEDSSQIRIAVDEKFDREVQEFLEFMLCKPVVPIIVDGKLIKDAIEKQYGNIKDPSSIELKPKEASRLIGDYEKRVAKLINEGITRGASDIHWDCQAYGTKLLVRYRIDGQLIELNLVDEDWVALKIISHLKVIAQMNIDEKRLPQDGRLAWTCEGKKYDLRLSSLSTVHGESLVMRILDREDLNLKMEALGFSPQDWQKMEGLLNKPDGLLLITGPTGSGKTTTLYSALNYRSQFDGKIITVEDPIEYEFSHFAQIPVRATIGMTFASALRAMLRQSPDTIMIGEIRDKETAQIAINAALTGHLVLSTLHTNDALSAIYRLIDLGLEGYQIAAALRGVVSQRLVRKLCSLCKEPYEPNEEELSLLDFLEIEINQSTFYHGKGCANCHYTGFKGRLALFEILSITKKLSEFIDAGISPEDLKSHTEDLGITTLQESGMRKILEGLTTIEEVVAAIVAN